MVKVRKVKRRRMYFYLVGLSTAKAGRPYILASGSWLPVGERAPAGSPLSLGGSGAIPLHNFILKNGFLFNNYNNF